jgi:RimJ/RimL family protein N-acetyltransferase
VTVVGEGLVLRAWTLADAARMAVLFDDPDVAHWTPLASPFDATAATAYLERAQVLAGTRLQLAITTDGDDPLGEVMLDLPTAIAGYVVGRCYRRRGLASRALRVITAYAHDVASLPVVSLQVATGNTESIGVAQHAGYVLSDQPLLQVRNKGRCCELETWVHHAGS